MRRFGFGDLIVIGTAVIWGASFSVIKSAYAEFSPLAFTALRFTLASITLLLLVTALRHPLAIARRDLARVAAVGALHVGLYQIFFSLGLRDTTASNSVLIVNISPIITALLVWATRAEPIAGRQWLGIIMAAVGVGVLVSAGGELGAAHLRGDLLTLLAAASYGVTPVLVLPLYRRYSTLSVMAVSMAVGAALIVVVAIPDLLRQSWQVSPVAWAQFAYATLLAGALAYVLWYEGIRRIGPTRVAAYSYLIPVAGVLIATTMLREPFGPVHAAGAAITFAGVALTRWARPGQERAAAVE